MNSTGKSYGSLAAATILSFAVIWLTIFRGPEKVMMYDVFNYYLYLPATFKYDDPGIEKTEWLNEVLEKYDQQSSFYTAPRVYRDRHVIKYSMGMSVLMSPFYFAADAAAEPMGYPADGFSAPYHWFMKYGGLIYVLLGIFILRAALRKLFPDDVTAITLLIVVLGTNYLTYSYTNSMMQHIPLFTLYAGLIWLSAKWHESKSKSTSLAIAVVCGLITLIRPTDIICLLIPLLWNVRSLHDLKTKVRFLLKDYRSNFILFVLIFVAWGIPQFIYWMYTTGKPLFVSYQGADEGLDLMSPNFLNVFFSFENGWLVYSPLLLLGIIGLFFMNKQRPGVFWSVLCFVILNVWLVSSWSNWNYSGGFGHRAMIQSYPVWSLAIAASIRFLTKRNRLVRGVIGVAITALICLSIFQQWQFFHGILPMQRITADYYMEVFGATHKDEQAQELLLLDRSFPDGEKFTNQEDYTKERIYFEDYSNLPKDDKRKAIPDLVTGNDYLVLDSSNAFSGGPVIPFHDLTESDHAWIVARVKVLIHERHNPENIRLVATFTHEGEAYKYHAKSLSADEVEFGKWNKIEVEYLTPRVRNGNDEFSIYVWYDGDDRIFVDDFEVYKFTK
ncbi:hypothetical protein [Halocola ammonii]